jgi:(2Fe-2S) ferredoxin
VTLYDFNPKLEIMPQFKTHVFICTNGKPDQIGKCASKGSESLHAHVKDACRDLGPSVRINKSGCLGQCEHGIASVIYPQGEWLLELAESDAEKLVDLIRNVHSKNS